MIGKSQRVKYSLLMLLKTNIWEYEDKGEMCIVIVMM